MNSDSVFDEIVGKIADGEPIDWAAAEQRVATPADRALLDQLRVLDRLSETHRSTALDETLPPPKALVDPQLEPLPRRWGRYRLVARLGAGGYGAVFRAHDDDLERDLAIKLLHRSTHGNLSDRVKAEGQALARVRDPNVLTVYDVEEHEQQLGLCMEHLDGETLDEIVRREGPMSVGAAIAAAAAVCRGLVAVHDAGLLHRDIKARNVMRERHNGRVVLMDFGAGLDESARGLLRAATVGTPLYMAPETFRHQPQSRQSDVYALGVLLYFLLTATYPVTGLTPEAIRDAHRAGRRTPIATRRPGLRPDVVAIVERALAPDPSERYASAAALLRDLTAAAQPLPRWQRLARGMAMGAIAGFALIALSGVLAARTFNRVLDRPARFDLSSTADTLWLGVQAMVLPAAVIAVLVCASAALQLVLALLPPLGRWWRTRWLRLASWLAIPEHERPAIVGRCVVLVAFVALAAVLIAFRDMLFSFTVMVTAGDLARFAPLAPDNPRSLLYRLVLAAVLFLLMVGWGIVERVRQTHEGAVPMAVRAAVIALVVLAVIFLMAPYKLMSPHNQMPVAVVDGHRCYLLGERTAEASVYCPAWPAPRVRVLNAGVAIASCGFTESVFRSPGAIGCARAD